MVNIEKYRGQFLQGSTRKPAKSKSLQADMPQATFKPDGRILPKRISL